MGRLLLGVALIALSGCVGDPTLSSEWSDATGVTSREGDEVPLSAGPDYEKRLGNDAVDVEHLYPFGSMR
jgi:hypothetical protein